MGATIPFASPLPPLTHGHSFSRFLSTSAMATVFMTVFLSVFLSPTPHFSHCYCHSFSLSVSSPPPISAMATVIPPNTHSYSFSLFVSFFPFHFTHAVRPSPCHCHSFSPALPPLHAPACLHCIPEFMGGGSSLAYLFSPLPTRIYGSLEGCCLPGLSCCPAATSALTTGGAPLPVQPVPMQPLSLELPQPLPVFIAAGGHSSVLLLPL